MRLSSIGKPETAVTLTRRELEVLMRMARGMTSTQIADELYVSRRTVEFHAANIYGKLGAKNRIEALNTARALRLIPAFPADVDALFDR